MPTTDTLDAPGVPCVNCELSICGEPQWLGEAGPLCETCADRYLDTFTAADQARMTRPPDKGRTGRESEIWEKDGMMATHSYRSMDDAPKDGTPIIAVVGGIEMAVLWDDNGFLAPGWFYFDEDEGGTTYHRVKDDVRGWRELVFG